MRGLFGMLGAALTNENIGQGLFQNIPPAFLSVGNFFLVKQGSTEEKSIAKYPTV